MPLNTFQANYASRTQTITHTQKSLAGSLLAATGMTLGIFGMGITGTCWSWDVSSFQELKQRLERRANNEFVVTNMPLDSSSFNNIFHYFYVLPALELLLVAKIDGNKNGRGLIVVCLTYFDLNI